jgi:hypothetical protein
MAYLIDPTFVPIQTKSTQKYPEQVIKEVEEPSAEPIPSEQIPRVAEKMEKPQLPEPQKIEPQRQVQPPVGYPQFPGLRKDMPGLPSGVLTGLLAGFATIIFVLSIATYLYYSLCLFLIAKKLGVPAAWTALVPIIQVWTMVRSAGKLWWWILLLLIPFVSFIVLIYIWICITENLGRNKWLGLLMLLPIINFVFLGVLAFSKTGGPTHTREAAPA